MTDGLVVWLRAQLDEDERVARDATPGPWRGNANAIHGSDGWLAETQMMGDYEQGQADAEHIALHDPTRVLAEVDAKRRILDLHPHRRFATLPDEWPEHWKAEIKPAFPGTPEPYVGCERDGWNADYQVAEADWWCETVRLLALPYADRPGYRDEWAPDAG